MAISKIKTGSIADNAVTNAKVDSSYTTAITTNPEFAGTEAAKMPSGTTEQRANAKAGDIRFNTTLSLMEYYDGTDWKAIDAPPVVTTISPTSFNGESGTTITITGSNFQGGATATFITTGGTSYNAAVTTVVSSSSITATTPQDFTVADEPISIKVTNPSGLSSTLTDALDAGSTPTWSTSSGSLATIYNSQRGSYSSISVSATDPDAGSTITYSVTSGSLPTGMSLNTSTGAITGTPDAVGSDTTSSFTVRASDNAGNTADRSFSITVKAPVVTQFTSTGSSSWTAPSGISSVDVLVVAGGGSGGGSNPGNSGGGGGGAGGLVYIQDFPVTAGSSYPLNVGSGGSPVAPGVAPQGTGNPGSPSTIFGLTAIGGGGGAREGQSGQSGGSGGGGAGSGQSGGPGTQPAQPGSSGTYGFGNPGGNHNGSGDQFSGGGGGAGSGGTPGASPVNPSGAGPGGNGYSVNITGSSVTYAGGGGGGSGNSALGPGGIGGPGQGGDGGYAPTNNNAPGTNGGTNRGSGGGGSGRNAPLTTSGPSGGGGPGVIIIRY